MRWAWLLLGVLILAVPAAASVANFRAGRGDLADVLWLALAAGYTAWACWHLSHLPARRRPTTTFEEREVYPPTRLERILREDAASRPVTRAEIRQQFGVDVHDVFEEDR